MTQLPVTPPPSYIKLHPHDWFRATWRHLPPEPRPPIPHFDLEERCQRISKCMDKLVYWQWERLKISPFLSRAEAHFWLTIIGHAHGQYNLSPEAVTAQFSTQQFDGVLTATQIDELLFPPERRQGSYFYSVPKIAFPLVNLHTWPELIAGIQRWEKVGYWTVMQLIAGIGRYFLPYLTEDERIVMRPLLRQAALETSTQVNPHPQGSKTFAPLMFLAAMVGDLDDLLLPLIAQPKVHQAIEWNVHKLICGLSNAEQVMEISQQYSLSFYHVDDVRGWLAHTETQGLERVRHAIEKAYNKGDAERLFRVLAQVEHEATVPEMLALRQSKHVSALAHDWLNSHPQLTIPALLNLPVSDNAAAAYLRVLAIKGHTGLITTTLAKMPENSRQGWQTLLGDMLTSAEATPAAATPDWLLHPLSLVKPGQTPLGLDYAELPPLTVRGYTLSRDEGNALLHALNRSSLSGAHVLVRTIKEQGEPHLLDAWVWRLFELWQKLGALPKDKWVLNGLGLLGHDGVALKLTPLIRQWPSEGQYNRAVLALNCLRTIGTDTALMQIHAISQKVKSARVKQKAQEALNAIAQERGLSPEALADRIVPDCGLDSRGRKQFDYGRRHFTFVLTPELKPMVRDEAGKLSANLPKPGTRDDATVAAAAFTDWQIIKKQVREVAKVQSARLEQAMIAGRRWTGTEFTTLLVNHPLLFHLVRLLVWGVFAANGTLRTSFRVTDERDWADRNDEPLMVAAADHIGLVHPRHLDNASRSAWIDLFNDYELIPPFPQLGREMYQLTPEEQSGTEITHFATTKVNAAAFVGTLEKLGWQRGAALDAGIFHEHSKVWSAQGVTTIVTYSGVPMGLFTDWEAQSIESCFFVTKAQRGYSHYVHKLPLAEIDPLIISEVLRDLAIVSGKGQ